MATYEYWCETDGLVEVRLPMGTAPPRRPCPTCRTETRRVYSSPMVSTAPRHLVAAIDRAEKTRDEPDVVTSVPAAGARRPRPARAVNPALSRLPRP
jgi:putative FmdB family regulatory protein